MERGLVIQKATQKIKQGALKKFGRLLAAGYLINVLVSGGMAKMVFIVNNTQKTNDLPTPDNRRGQIMEYTEEFETFWSLYPKRWNRDLSRYIKRKKWPAFEKWQKLSQAIRNDCLAKARLIKATEGTPRDCVTWLNQRGWDDIELSAPPLKALPAEITPKLKIVESHIVNINNERNRQMNELRSETKGK